MIARAAARSPTGDSQAKAGRNTRAEASLAKAQSGTPQALLELYTRTASAAVLEREARAASGCAGPGHCDCPHCRLSAASGPGPYRAPDDSRRPQPYGVIVNDEDAAAESQIRRSEFVEQTAAATRAMADEELRAIGRSAQECPYLNYWLEFYRRASPAHIERVIQVYANPARVDPDGLREAVVERVRLSIRRYIETHGTDMALPPGIDANTRDDGISDSEPSTETMQAFAEGAGPAAGSNASAIRTRLGTGTPMDVSTRARMERSFGQSFQDVQLHTDRHASRLSRSLAARAFTVGEHVAFAEQQYRPGTLMGDLLLAHELAHVVQQRNARGEVQPLSDRPGGLGLEDDANLAAAGAVASLYLEGMEIPRLQPRLFSPLALSRCDSCDGGVTPAPPSPTPTPPSGITTSLADFLITGKNIDAGDIDNLYFDRNSATLTPPDVAKIARIISTHGASSTLTLNGFASEDESAGIATQRVTEVDTRLTGASPPHTGTRTPRDLTARGAGVLEYRSFRKVTVQASTTGSPTPPPPGPSCSSGPAVSCGSSFTGAHPRATAMLGSAVTALGASPLAANTTSLLTTLFGGTANLSTIQSNIAALQTHVGAMGSQHRCHDGACDPGCSRPAYNCGAGVGTPAADPCATAGSKAMITFCNPDFASRTVDGRAYYILHEGAHGTAGLATRDIAYHNQREIITLTPAQALQNTDSYVLLIFNLHTPGSANIGPATPDVIGGVNCPGGDPDLCRAIAFSAKWLEVTQFDISLAYGTVRDSIGSASPWAEAFNRDTVHQIAPLFGLTDPGTSAPFATPTNDDKIKLAGIHDRYRKMMGVTAKPASGTRGSGAAESWTDGTPTTTLTLGSPYAGLSTDVARTRHLVSLVVSSTAGIDPRLRSSYVDAADQVRQHRSLGP